MTGNLSCCSNSAVRAPPGREPPRVSISGSLQKMEDIAHELDADSDDQQRQRSARHVWRSSRTESGSLDSPESEEYARHVRIKERPYAPDECVGAAECSNSVPGDGHHSATRGLSRSVPSHRQHLLGG